METENKEAKIMKSMVVIPTYNERSNLEPLVRQIFSLSTPFHVLVVDDNSPDGTGDLAEKLAKEFDGRLFVLHRPGKMGLGSAYLTGFRYSLDWGADYIFEMDADFSHDPQYLPKFLDLMDKYDVVIGSRYVNGISVVNWPLNRLALSLAASKYVRVITGLPLSDCTTGYKCFSRKSLEALDLKAIFSNGYSFQIELNYRLFKKGYKIGELPIIFVDRHSGSSKMSGSIVREALYVVWKLRLGL